MFSNIRNFCLCIVTLFCTADGDIRNFSRDPSVIITSVNDSAFLLSRPNESTHEYKNKDLDWLLKPSTLNVILEHSHSDNSEILPLRKRETKFKNHSRTHINETKFNDNLYTVYFNGNTNVSDQPLLRHRKQAGNDFYKKELDELDNSNTGEVEIPTSPLVNLRDKTPKTIKDTSIIVAPMPILGNDKNTLRESGEVEATDIETDDDNFDSSKVSSEEIEKSKEQTTASAENIYTTEQTDSVPAFFTNKNEFHINTPESLEEYTTEKETEKYFKVSDFIPDKSSESLATNKMVIEESTPKSVILESEKRLNNRFSNFEDITTINIQNRYENKSVSNDFYANTSNPEFLTSTNGTIYELEYETSTNSSVYDLDLSLTNDALYSNQSNTIKSIITTAAVPNLFLMGIQDEDEDYINNNSDLKMDGSSTSGIDVDRKQTYTSSPIVTTSPKEKFLDAKNENYMIRSEKTTTAFTSNSRTPDLPFSEVKIIPVRAREYTILMAGIILCCVGVVLIVGVLIIFFYRNKKTTSNDVEMVSTVRFDEA